MPTIEVIIATPGYSIGKSALVREFAYFDYKNNTWVCFYNVNPQRSWDHAAVHLLKGRSGYKIEFPVY